MTLDSDWDSRSMDSRPSDFNDGAEVLLTNADFEIEAPRTGEEANQSRSSTPESHKNFCNNYQGHGQGATVYSCGCYRYKDMARYKCPEPLPSDLEQASETGNGDSDVIGALSLKRKILHGNDTAHSISRDITTVWEVSVPGIELPQSKRRKLERQSESFEEGPPRSLIKVAKEVVALGEALLRMKEDLDGQRTILLTICEALTSVTGQEGSFEW
ncbi:hypothetical protein EDD22DRAFT_844773 [Suillus occidentalis]|nr:hypothetical protein EDD22DRAFT_850475 [Suillus occidentalis]KAG1767019.1 hypothetical protein EDD22DRAFT_844773 [Suillus occidentalis]